NTTPEPVHVEKTRFRNRVLRVDPEAQPEIHGCYRPSRGALHQNRPDHRWPPDGPAPRPASTGKRDGPLQPRLQPRAEEAPLGSAQHTPKSDLPRVRRLRLAPPRPRPRKSQEPPGLPATPEAAPRIFVGGWRCYWLSVIGYWYC